MDLNLKKKTHKKKAKKITSHDFLASMSHEIRTPINGILGISSLLEEMQMPDEQKKFVKLINNSVQSLLSLINDILDFSKIEAGKMPITPKAFCIRDEMNSIIEMFKPIANKKNLNLELSLINYPDKIFIGDFNRIKQIVLNLLGNAIKFTEKGKVVVKVEFNKINEQMTEVIISIKDTGVGISKEKLAKLFNPYIQTHDLKTSGATGTGLGLYISKKLAEMMRGYITAKSVFGVGSEFIFYIPLETEERVRILKQEDLKKQTKLSGRILLAEDNYINQMVTEKFLKKSGIEVVVVNNGKEALEYLEKDSKFDLILMDCYMPILDGFQATSQIRKSNKPYSRIPILALSASVLKPEQDECITVGMNDFISKPVTFEVLENKIKEWLEKNLEKAS